jgi:hypothetical protein
MLILPMPFGAFQPPKPAYRILLRYPPDGHGYIFSCAVIIFHPQVCAGSFNSGLMNDVKLLFASPAFELFFPSDGFANVFITLKGEQALAAIGRSDCREWRCSCRPSQDARPFFRWNHPQSPLSTPRLLSLHGKSQEHISGHAAPLAIPGVDEDHAIHYCRTRRVYRAPIPGFAIYGRKVARGIRIP